MVTLDKFKTMLREAGWTPKDDPQELAIAKVWLTLATASAAKGKR